MVQRSFSYEYMNVLLIENIIIIYLFSCFTSDILSSNSRFLQKGKRYTIGTLCDFAYAISYFGSVMVKFQADMRNSNS